MRRCYGIGVCLDKSRRHYPGGILVVPRQLPRQPPAHQSRLLRHACQDTLSKSGTATPEELKAIANFINIATGRGNMGDHAMAAESLATVFFSPRLMLSRFQILAGQPLYGGTARTRKMIAGEYARFLVGVGVVMGLGALAGASLEADPRSSDFGKLRFGNTRLDPLGGLGQVSVLLSRLGTGFKKNSAGELIPIRGEDVPHGGSTSADVIGRFLRTKLAPVVGAGLDLLTGKDVVGHHPHPRRGRALYPFERVRRVHGLDHPPTLRPRGAGAAQGAGPLSARGPARWAAYPPAGRVRQQAGRQPRAQRGTGRRGVAALVGAAHRGLQVPGGLRLGQRGGAAEGLQQPGPPQRARAARRLHRWLQ